MTSFVIRKASSNLLSAWLRPKHYQSTWFLAVVNIERRNFLKGTTVTTGGAQHCPVSRRHAEPIFSNIIPKLRVAARYVETAQTMKTCEMISLCRSLVGKYALPYTVVCLLLLLASAPGQTQVRSSNRKPLDVIEVLAL